MMVYGRLRREKGDSRKRARGIWRKFEWKSARVVGVQGSYANGTCGIRECPYEIGSMQTGGYCRGAKSNDCRGESASGDVQPLLGILEISMNQTLSQSVFR